MVAVLAVALAGAGTWSIGALTGNDMVEAALAQTKSLGDLLGQRSPGERTEAQLTKTAHAHGLARHQRIAPPRHAKAQPPAAPKVNMADIAQLLQTPTPTVAAPAAGNVFAPIAMDLPPASIGTIVAPPPGGTPPGGPPPASFPTPQPKDVVTLPSAVPEPGTWATMLLGFALVGWRMRRTMRSRRTPLTPELSR